MSYRVETALSKRAGCQSTECKASGIKIDKDELRLGIWVEYGDRGGWAWRHWGCVTGKVLQGLRNLVADPDAEEGYRWDMLDGYDSGDKNSLDKNPHLQEKIRRCITQGFIDPEDFKGDPEMNVLGTAGLRTKESKKKTRDEQKEKAQNEEIEALKAQIASLKSGKSSEDNSDIEAKLAAAQADLDKHLAKATPGGKKRVKDESDAEEGSPVKKKRATKKKVKAEEEGDDDEDENVKPAPKSRAKKVKKEDDDGEDNMEDIKPAPAMKSRAKKAVKKKEDSDDDVAGEAKPAPPKKSRAKKAVKKEEDVEMTGTAEDSVKNEEDNDSASKPAPKKRAPPNKKAKKAEIDEDAEPAVKNEDGEDSVKPAPKKRAPRGKKGVKKEQVEGTVGIDDDEPKAKPAAKKGRKKAVKGESVDIKDEPAAESSNPGISEGSSVLSEPQDQLKGVKDEPMESIGVAPDTEDVSAAAAEAKDLVVPTHKRRTRSRTASNKV
ncbi:hypothetical protein VTL71DRAFT_6591 [Oculimacula yallundae]|uniref:PARP-type domain-containing protein n=1 Tax=Oculimacula yallundae TaxID=86028 RepID=A0ABR4BXE3_9HELO